MNILLTNDDGYFAPGLKALGEELIRAGHKLTIVAPEFENSGKSHSITLMQDLKFNKVKIDGLDCPSYSVSGTPADCVRAAVEIFGKDFDFCFSGCNLGYNAGMDILYSGTVSAAIEANVFGISSIALSAEFNRKDTNFKTAALVGLDIFNKVKSKISTTQVLNINVPSVEYDELLGVKVCKVGDTVMDKYSSFKTDSGYSLKLHGRNKYEYAIDTDRYFLEQGYATLTPLIYDLTNEFLINELRNYI